MTNIEIRLPLGLGHRLLEAIHEAGRHEYVAFCLAGQVLVGDKRLLLIRGVLTLPDDAYAGDHTVGAAWAGSSMVPAIEAAMQDGAGVLLVHAHDHAGPPCFSRPDDQNARRLLPMFQRRVPQGIHGSLVLSRTHAAGLVLPPGGVVQEVRPTIRWFGSTIVDWKPEGDVPEFDVSRSLDGEALLVGGRLNSARVAVVGLSGGGSHVVQQLARVGVGSIVGIDDDVVEGRNRHKLVGLAPKHVDGQWRKVDVMAEVVREAGTGARFEGVPYRLPAPQAIEALQSADVIVGCVDNLHARADLQELAWRFVVPYVDIGVSIRALPSGSPSAAGVSVGGNILTLIPGGFCMWCAGFLSDEKIQNELGGRPNRSYFQNRNGEAQVVSFNGTVASQAVTEVLQLLVGFAGRSLDPRDLALGDGGLQRGYRKFDGVRGEVRDWGSRRRDDCPRCTSLLGRGAVTWSPPGSDLPASASVGRSPLGTGRGDSVKHELVQFRGW